MYLSRDAGRRLCGCLRCRLPGQLAPVAHQLGYDGLGMEGVVGEEGGGAGALNGVVPCLAEVVAAARGVAVVDEHGAADVDHAGEGGAGAPEQVASPGALPAGVGAYHQAEAGGEAADGVGPEHGAEAQPGPAGAVDAQVPGAGDHHQGLGGGVDALGDPPGVGQKPGAEAVAGVVDEQPHVAVLAAQAHHLEGEDEQTGHAAGALVAVGVDVPAVEGAGVYVVADGFHAAKVHRFAAGALRIWGMLLITRMALYFVRKSRIFF